MVQLRNKVNASIKIHLYKNRDLTCIYNSKSFIVCRLLKHAIITFNIETYGKTLISYDGRRLTDRKYLNLIEYLPNGDILGVHYLTADKTTGSVIRKYDVYNKRGELKYKDVDSEKMFKDYYLDDSVLYSRGLHQISVKNLGNKIRIKGDNFYSYTINI